MALPGPEEYGHGEYRSRLNWPLIVGLVVLGLIAGFIAWVV